MKKIVPAVCCVLMTLACEAQPLPFPTFLTPAVLHVGSGPADLMLFNQDYRAGLTALWNGSARPTFRGGNSSFSYTIKLTAADLAAPQLANVTMVDSQTGAVVDDVYCPVGYDVVPTGIAFDNARNRLYVATPQQTGDPRFPPNSVVAVDLASGNVGPVLSIGSSLGDLALSDDGTALYVVVEGANAVRRINPSTLTALEDLTFRSATLSPNVVHMDMITVMPGKPETVALGFTPFSGLATSQLAIFDRGVKRPNVIESGCCQYSSILFSPDGKYFFQSGYTTYASGPNSGDYRPATFRYTVDSTGFLKQSLSSSVGGAAAIIAGGTLYTSLATTIDYESMQTTGNFGIGGPITVDAENQRAFILYTPPAFSSSGSTPPVKLQAFALPSLEPLGGQNVGVSAIPSLKDSEKLIRFGVDGMIVPSPGGLLVFHTPVAGPAPVSKAANVVNAASQTAGAIAPGEILTIYGTNLGPSPPRVGDSTAGFFPSILGEVQVWFGQLPGVMLLSSTGQINVVAPFGLKAGSAVDLQIWNFGIPSARIPLQVAPAAPAFFTRNGSGEGQVAVINQDGSVNTASPASSIVTLFGTGAGLLAGAVDGAVARQAISVSLSARVAVAGRDAQVLYAGAAPGLVNGVFQLNVRLPDDISPGLAPITVAIGGQESPKGTSLEIR